jgi:glucosamine--fructose-6-phosphate aminotransferase (isomerizing)
MTTRFLLNQRKLTRLLISRSFKSTTTVSFAPNVSKLPILAYSATSSGDSSEGKLNWKLLSLLGAALGATTIISQRKAENCGIVGVVGGDDAVGFLLEGLTILRNRGYDSAGVATTDGSDIVVTKYASRESTSDSIDLVRANSAKHVGHVTGIAHTRW